MSSLTNPRFRATTLLIVSVAFLVLVIVRILLGDGQDFHLTESIVSVTSTAGVGFDQPSQLESAFADFDGPVENRLPDLYLGITRGTSTLYFLKPINGSLVLAYLKDKPSLEECWDNEGEFADRAINPGTGDYFCLITSEKQMVVIEIAEVFRFDYEALVAKIHLVAYH